MIKATLKLLSLAAALTVTSMAAHADAVHGIISINGYDTYTSNTINFVGTGETSAIATTGTFSDLFPGGTGTADVTLHSFNFAGGFVNPTQVYSVTNNGVTVSFSLVSITSSSIDANGDLKIIGRGIFSETGYDNAEGTFNLTSQGGGTGATVTFSATSVAPTPEPNTLLLLGTGLMSSAGALYRRRRKAA